MDAGTVSSYGETLNYLEITPARTHSGTGLAVGAVEADTVSPSGTPQRHMRPNTLSPVSHTGAAEPDPAQAREPGGSLIPLAPQFVQTSFGRAERPSAAFLAHLIATAQQAPQTRQRRRAEPSGACARYSWAHQRPRTPAPLCSM